MSGHGKVLLWVNRLTETQLLRLAAEMSRACEGRGWGPEVAKAVRTVLREFVNAHGT